MAQLTETIEKWLKGYEMFVNQSGNRLSRGHSQPIGIVSALYKNVNIIIPDQAISALDHKMEGAVKDVINSLSPDPTIIMVAHRLSKLESCDVILELEGGKMKEIRLI